jgi:hypothetical protein
VTPALPSRNQSVKRALRDASTCRLAAPLGASLAIAIRRENRRGARGRDRTLGLPVIRLRPRTLTVVDRGYGKRGASLCSCSCTSLKCPYFCIAYARLAVAHRGRRKSPIRSGHHRRTTRPAIGQALRDPRRHLPARRRGGLSLSSCRAPKKYPCVATLAGLLLRLAPVDWAPRMKVEARAAVERALSMPIERRGADAALRFGFGAPRRVFEGAHILLTPSTLLPHQSQSGVTDLYGLVRSRRSTVRRT